MNMLAFSLPMPPSTNNLFATDFKTKRRFITKAYREWRDEAEPLINLAWQRAGHPEFERHMSLTIHIGLTYIGDISGRIKAIEDAIGKAIPGLPDDRYYDRVVIERVPGLDGARVLLGQLAPPHARSIGELIDPIMADIVGRVEQAA
jgi:hypothetical protein